MTGFAGNDDGASRIEIIFPLLNFAGIVPDRPWEQVGRLFECVALSNVDDVRVYIKMLKETSAAVEAALKANKSLDQMKKEKILAPWSKFASDFQNDDVFTETLYYSLTNTKGPFVKHN